MNLVDSSGWLEYFSDGPNAQDFADPIERTAELVVPTVCLYEVFKKILRERNERDAFTAVGVMQQGKVVDLTPTLALNAAKLGVEHRLPFADSVILATARAFDAVLWTQDEHFEGLIGVRYFETSRERRG